MCQWGQGLASMIFSYITEMSDVTALLDSTSVSLMHTQAAESPQMETRVIILFQTVSDVVLDCGLTNYISLVFTQISHPPYYKQASANKLFNIVFYHPQVFICVTMCERESEVWIISPICTHTIENCEPLFN